MGFGSSSGRCAHSRHLAEAHPQVLIIAPTAGKYPVTVTDANSATAATTVTCTYSTHGKKTRLGCQTP